MLDRVLLVTGTVGVGKTTVAREVCALLSTAAEPIAYVDLDKLSGYWPRTADDPFNTHLTAQNLGSVAANFVTEGARSLVIAGVVETQTVFDLYERAAGRSIAVVRLVAQPAEIQERLRRRHRDDDAGLRWCLERAPALDAILDASTVKMAVVSASASPPTVAAAVVTAVGWEPTPGA